MTTNLDISRNHESLRIITSVPSEEQESAASRVTRFSTGEAVHRFPTGSYPFQTEATHICAIQAEHWRHFWTNSSSSPLKTWLHTSGRCTCAPCPWPLFLMNFTPGFVKQGLHTREQRLSDPKSANKADVPLESPGSHRSRLCKHIRWPLVGGKEPANTPCQFYLHFMKNNPYKLQSEQLTFSFDLTWDKRWHKFLLDSHNNPAHSLFQYLQPIPSKNKSRRQWKWPEMCLNIVLHKHNTAFTTSFHLLHIALRVPRDSDLSAVKGEWTQLKLSQSGSQAAFVHMKTSCCSWGANVIHSVTVYSLELLWWQPMGDWLWWRQLFVCMITQVVGAYFSSSPSTTFSLKRARRQFLMCRELIMKTQLSQWKQFLLKEESNNPNDVGILERMHCKQCTVHFLRSDWPVWVSHQFRRWTTV